MTIKNTVRSAIVPMPTGKTSGSFDGVAGEKYKCNCCKERILIGGNYRETWHKSAGRIVRERYHLPICPKYRGNIKWA